MYIWMMNSWYVPPDQIYMYVNIPSVCICFCEFSWPWGWLVTLVAPLACVFAMYALLDYVVGILQCIYGWWAIVFISPNHIYLFMHIPFICMCFLWVPWTWPLASDLLPLPQILLLLCMPFLIALCAFSNAYMDDDLLIFIPSNHIYMFMHRPIICMCFLWVP